MRTQWEQRLVVWLGHLTERKNNRRTTDGHKCFGVIFSPCCCGSAVTQHCCSFGSTRELREPTWPCITACSPALVSQNVTTPVTKSAATFPAFSASRPFSAWKGQLIVTVNYRALGYIGCSLLYKSGSDKMFAGTRHGEERILESPDRRWVHFKQTDAHKHQLPGSAARTAPWHRVKQMQIRHERSITPVFVASCHPAESVGWFARNFSIWPGKHVCTHTARRSASRVAKICSWVPLSQTRRRRVSGSSSPAAGQIMSVTEKWIINIEQRASLLLIVTGRGNKFSDCLTLLANLT